VGALARIIERLRDDLADWPSLRLTRLLFEHRSAALLMLTVLAGLSLVVLVARVALGFRTGRHQIAVPALLGWPPPSRLAWVRILPLLVFLVGLALLAVALADPYVAFAQHHTTFPGRRIAIVIDASASMNAGFPTTRLREGGSGQRQAAFFAAVAAAEVFIRERIKGKYRDLVALVEFGDDAYVVTPFTSDYNNILLSTSLIGDWSEFVRFPDPGTTIGLAVEQSISLFRAFDFLSASGNLLVIFSDGQDTQAIVHGRPVSEILAGAVRAKIPVYFIRTSYNQPYGGVIPDEIWKPAIEKTGGRFYVGSDEGAILRAVQEIDRVSADKIEITEYTTRRPTFGPCALAGTGCWAFALLLQLAVPYFNKFP
jgi:hypothetical protein